MDPTATLGARVKALTQARPDLRREAVAAQAGVSFSTLGNIERGKHSVMLKTLVALAQVFHVSTDYLLGLTDDPAPRPVPQAHAPASGPAAPPTPRPRRSRARHAPVA